MTALPHTRALLTDLATALRLPALEPEADGGVALAVGDDVVRLYPEDDRRLLVVVPVGVLPAEPGHALTLWLLRRNFLDSDLGPVRLGADVEGNLVLWGRVPLGRLDGVKLAGLVDALAGEAERIRAQL